MLLFPCAWSGNLACFGFARVHPPLRLSRFRWLPLGVPWGGQVFVDFPSGLAWVVCFGGPPLSLVCRGAGAGAGRAPRASRRHGVVLLWALLAAGAGTFGCWRCCFCHPNFSALSIWGQFRSKYTHQQVEPRCFLQYCHRKCQG